MNGIRNLLLLILIIWFVNKYLQQFGAIELFLYYVGWWFIVGGIVAGIVCFFVKISKGNSNGT